MPINNTTALSFLLRQKSVLGLVIAISILGSGTSLFGQSYYGFASDNYSGVHGVLANPAMVADSPYWADINLGSLSAYGGSDGIGTDVMKLATDETYTIRRDAEYTTKDENHVYGNIDVLGPSFIFAINPKYAIGLTTRVRGFANINQVNGTLFENAWRKFDSSEDFNLEEGDFNITVHAWSEFGLTLGAIIYEKNKHFLKTGATLKYLRGLGAGTIDGFDINANYSNADNGINTLTSTGELTYILSEGYYINETFEYSKAPSAIGADFGLIYEWRPENERYITENKEGDTIPMADKNKYRFRIGLSITDFGTSLGYNSATLRTYNTDKTVDVQELVPGDIENRLDDLYLDTEVAENDLKVFTPTALHVNLDWKVKRRLYLNVNTDVSLVSADKIRTNRSMSSLAITPRFESKWISVYTPFSLRQQGDFAFGIGLRAGPLVIGSGSVFSNLINKASKTADVYAALKIPLFRKSTGDESPPIEEEEEEEKEVDLDSDGDLIPDSEDKCPLIPGLPEDEGCPMGSDSDGDGIPDSEDECPENSGLSILGGCPDTDADGVADIDDVCPEIYGIPSRDGCPDNIDKAVPTINNFANVILFKHSKSSFQEATFETLNAMVEILSAYPKSQFVIEGHTDDSGKHSTNMKLSVDRAEAVRDYLVANGINISRLKTVGFGETKPLSTNKTEIGKAVNRRVVVRLLSTE